MNAGKQEIKIKRVSSRKRTRDSPLKSHRTPVKKKGKGIYFKECSKTSGLDRIMADLKATEVWCCPNKVGIISELKYIINCVSTILWYLTQNICLYVICKVINSHPCITIIKLIFKGTKTLYLSCFCSVLQWQWGFIWRLWQYPGG